MRRLIIFLLISFVAGQLWAETKSTEIPIYFRLGKSSYDPSFLGNAASVDSFVKLVTDLGDENIRSIEVNSYASPDGVYEYNLMLSRKRAVEVKWLLRTRAPEFYPKVQMRLRGEAWGLLRDRVAADEKLSQNSRDRILKFLDNSSISDDTRKWRLANWLGSDPAVGDLYQYLLRNHYRYLRSAVIIVINLEPVSPDNAPAVQAQPLAEPVPAGAQPAADQPAVNQPASGGNVAGDPVSSGAAAASGTEPATGNSFGGSSASQAKPHPTTGEAGGTPATEPRVLRPSEGVPAADSSETATGDSLGLERPATLGTVRGRGPSEMGGMSSEAANRVEGQAAPEQQVAEQPVTEQQQDGGQGLLAAAAAVIAREATIGISTNIPYDITYIPHYGLTSIPSFSLEYYPRNGRWTFGGDVEWPMWQHDDKHKYMQINNITLWTRRYFKEPEDDRFKGLYLLGNINAVRYGIGFDEKGWIGEGLGASLGIGHKWILGKSHFFFDAGLALGVLWSRYDPYYFSDEATHWYYYDYTGKPDDFSKRNQRLLWFGPTRLYLSIGYDLNLRKKR